MSLLSFLQTYWPFLLLAGWFAYKWWSARRVAALLPTLRSQGAVLLDVRSVAEFAAAHAPGSLNIPLPELGSRLGEVTRGVPVVVCCASGTRSAMAVAQLKHHGYSVVYNGGSWRTLLA